MSRRLLACLLRRLDRSPLPFTDPVRLELEAELLDLLTPTSRVRLRTLVFDADYGAPASRRDSTEDA